LPQELIAAFEERSKEMKDDDFLKVETDPCDVKSIMNSPGVTDFWFRAIINHQLGDLVKEKDRPILQNLVNIELDLHNETVGKGFDLHFTFDNNSYFTTTNSRNTDKLTVITKNILMKSE